MSRYLQKKGGSRLVSLLLCGAMLTAPLLSSCGGKDEPAPAETGKTASSAGGDAQEADTLSPEEYALYSIAGAESAYPDIPYVLEYDHGDGKAGDFVTYDEFRYYQLLYKNYFDGGDDTYWTANPDMLDRVSRLFHDEIIRNHAVLAECEKYGLLLTPEEQEMIDRANAEMVASFGSREIFNEALVQYFMTEYFYNYQSVLVLLYDKLEFYYKENGQILTDDADIRGMLNTDDFIRAKHILIKNDPGEKPEDNRAKAEEIYEKLQNGEDFDALMYANSEDTGLQTNPDGYYFFRGEMDEAFENASFALEEGEMSGIVETSYGYHIILRCEKENTYMDENFASIKQSYLGLRFYQVLDDVVAGWTTKTCENYDTYNDWSYALSVGQETK